MLGGRQAQSLARDCRHGYFFLRLFHPTVARRCPCEHPSADLNLENRVHDRMSKRAKVSDVPQVGEVFCIRQFPETAHPRCVGRTLAHQNKFTVEYHNHRNTVEIRLLPP